MVKTTKKQRAKCAKPQLYQTPRGDFMADMGEGRFVPIAQVGTNEYEEGEATLKLHSIPVEFTDLATIYEAPAYQLQFLGAGTSLDVYARSLEELFGTFALIRDNYLIENGEQELRFYRLDKNNGWQNIGGLYGADIARNGLQFGEFQMLLGGCAND